MQVSEPASDSGRGELVRLCRFLPRPSQVGGQKTGEAKLGAGFAANGSSDDGRQRFVSTAISPIYAAQILQLRRLVRRVVSFGSGRDRPAPRRGRRQSGKEK